jgi:hypothetical protein
MATICAAISILFTALIAVKVFLFKTTQNRKGKPMKTRKRKTHSRLKNHNKTVRERLAVVISDVGTEIVSGLALLG